MKTKQQSIQTKDGINFNICPVCKTIIHYPDGVYFRNGIEVHCQCVKQIRKEKQT
jgi:uncharacterized C2H2 Zn-finger protein